MTTPQDGDHAAEPTVVTTGMETGSDVGAPGDHSASEPPGGADQDVLEGLREDDSDPAVEDADAMTRAADDDAPLPSDLPAAPDADTPQFVEPR